MKGEHASNKLLISVEKFGRIPAANVFCRVVGPVDTNAIGFSLKRNQLAFTFFKDLQILHKMNIFATSNIFCPVSCSSLTGCKTTDPPNGNENNDDFVIEVKCSNHGEKFLKENSNSELYSLLTEVIESRLSIEFTFRVKTAGNCTANESNVHQETIAQAKLDQNSNSLFSQIVQEDVSYMICCTSCLQTISKGAVVFQKVLSLPSDWLEMSENWFCHKHDSCDSEQVICPQTNELFITPMHFNLNYSSFSNVVIEPNCNVAKCEKCLSLLGGQLHGQDGMLQCFKDKIMFVEENLSLKEVDTLNQSKESVKFIVATIQKELQSASSFKLCLECKVSKTEGTCVLLRVLSSSMERFCMQKDLSELADAEEIFETKEVIKVLYNTAPLYSALARSWLHDFSVEVFRVSDSMINAVLKVLISSSKTVLRDHLVVDNLLVGFLPVIDE